MATTTTFKELKKISEHPELVRLVQEQLVFIAPSGTLLPEKLLDEATGQLLSLDKTWMPLGLIADEGLQFEASTEKKERTAHGHANPVRTDIQKISRTISVTALEKFKKNLIELTEGIKFADDASGKLSNINTGKSGEITWDTPDVVSLSDVAMLVIGRDGTPDAEWVMGRGYSSVKLTEFPADNWGSEYLTTELKFDVQTSSTGPVQRNYLAGSGPAKYKDFLGFSQQA